LYRELQTHKDKEDFEKALKTVNKIIHVDRQDSLAFHYKIICLIQLARFNDVLSQINQCYENFDVDLSFEIAYTYYRLNNLTKSLEVINSVKKPELKHQELKAQILYKIEEYDDCYNLYRNIVKNSTDDFELERRTNISAVITLMGDESKITKDGADESYELRYNSGCSMAAIGEYNEAEEELKQAETQAREFLAEEGEAEEDIEDEIAIIKVQLAYVLQMQGKEKEAQALYNTVLKNKPNDIGLVAVASNNLLTINRDQNIFDSKKKLKATSAEGLENKLTTSQRGQIARNQALLAMFTAQVDLCKQLVDQLDSKIVPDKDYIIAGVLAKSGKYIEAVGQLEKDTSAIGILTSAQILLNAGEVELALKKLESLPADWTFRHGVLSALVTLYLALDNRTAAAELLKQASERNLKSKSKDSSDMNVVWRKTAEFHMNSGEPSVAAKSLEEMLRLNSDLRTLAQLVLAYAKFDLDKAMQAAKKLPPFNEESLDFDIATLEESAFAMGKSLKKNPMTPKTGKTPKTNEDGGVIKKKSKKKKKRLPKNYDPDATPDPERWLPKRERSYNKLLPDAKRIKKRKGMEKFTGAQGTDAGQSETFDYSGKTAGVKEEATSPQAAKQPVPAWQKRNKGKKGRR